MYYRIISLALILAALNTAQAGVTASPCSMELLSIRGPRETLAPVPVEEVIGRFVLKWQEMYLGIMRNQAGKLYPIIAKGAFDSEDRLLHGPRLASVRRLGQYNERWNGKREILVIGAVPRSPGHSVSIQRAADWNALPDPLLQIFEDNRIVMTGYPSAGSKPEMTEFGILMAQAHVKRSVSFDGVVTEAHLEGRTGILLQKYGHTYLPFILRDRSTGKEFLIETKGSGHPEGAGGFDAKHGFAIRGGLTSAEGDREFTRLEEERRANPDIQQDDGVRLAGMVCFQSSLGHGDRRYLIRLTPGTIRLSFRENPALEIPADLDARASSAMGKMWASFLSRDLLPATHPENIVVGEGFTSFYMTDYADIFHLSELPRNLGGMVRDAHGVLLTSIQSITQLPSYTPNIHFPLFRSALAATMLENHSVDADADADAFNLMMGAKDPTELAEVLWSTRFVHLVKAKP